MNDDIQKGVTKILVGALITLVSIFLLLIVEMGKSDVSGYGTVIRKQLIPISAKHHRGILPYTELIPEHYQLTIQIDDKLETVDCGVTVSNSYPIGKRVYCEYIIGRISRELYIFKYN